ncbi:MAG: hypothetical protein ACJA0Z_003789, partial [Halioglobus sp.]
PYADLEIMTAEMYDCAPLDLDAQITRSSLIRVSRARLACSPPARTRLCPKTIYFAFVKTLCARVRVNQILLTSGLLTIGLDRINR